MWALVFVFMFVSPILRIITCHWVRTLHFYRIHFLKSRLGLLKGKNSWQSSEVRQGVEVANELHLFQIFDLGRYSQDLNLSSFFIIVMLLPTHLLCPLFFSSSPLPPFGLSYTHTHTHTQSQPPGISSELQLAGSRQEVSRIYAGYSSLAEDLIELYQYILGVLPMGSNNFMDNGLKK